MDEIGVMTQADLIALAPATSTPPGMLADRARREDLLRNVAPFADARRHHRRRNATRLSLAVAVLALVAAIAILPAATASLPDPLWVAGIYDGGDYDDAVALAADADSLEPLFLSLPARPLASAPAVPAPPARREPQLRPLSPRAPPSA